MNFRERPSAAAWTANATCTIPPATTGAAESPSVPVVFFPTFGVQFTKHPRQGMHICSHGRSRRRAKSPSGDSSVSANHTDRTDLCGEPLNGSAVTGYMCGWRTLAVVLRGRRYEISGLQGVRDVGYVSIWILIYIQAHRIGLMQDTIFIYPILKQL